MAGKAAQKKLLRSMLMASDISEALTMAADIGESRAATLLLGLIADSDPKVKHLAASALGQVVQRLAASHLEAGREIMRRLVWSLNEESGAVPWGSPEAMGEIMAWHEPLADEFINLLISYIWTEGNYIEFEPLQAGVAWGIGRVAQEFPALVAARHAAGPLIEHMTSPDSQVRGCCAWALGFFADGQVAQPLNNLSSDQAECVVFNGGYLLETTVGKLANQAAILTAKR